MNPRAGAVYQATRGWNDRLARLSNAIDEKIVLIAGGEREQAVPNAPEVPRETPPGRSADQVKAESLPAQWQVIKAWRTKQAVEDWKGADQARMAIKLILKDSVQKVTGTDGRETFKTTLKPHEVRQITQALGEIQRIQRLSIGLSTENVGLDHMPDPHQDGQGHIEKDVTPQEQPLPTFIVEMSSRGKFLRPRPRRVK